ncbi:MAG: LicD family protein [Eubacteriales bacterium]|nr:LicD family protein [Eubacteriales bacterium]
MKIDITESFLKGEVRDGFYVENMMKRCWAAQLEVLGVIDDVCKKHGIQYFADWGTLLGAVRHGGFIPWDDDMDITMKREDYERFCLEASKDLPKGYKVFNIHTDDEWYDMLSHVVNTTTINYSKEHMERYHRFPFAAGLDIFPIDYIAPEEEVDDTICALMRIAELTAQTIDPKHCIKDITDTETLESIKAVQELSGSVLDAERPVKKQLLCLGERLGMMFSEKESTHLALMTDHACNRPSDVFPKEYFASSVDMKFECTTIPVPVGYEHILRQKYGDDYMTPRIGGANHDYPYYKKQQRILFEEIRKLDEKGVNIWDL